MGSAACEHDLGAHARAKSTSEGGPATKRRYAGRPATTHPRQPHLAERPRTRAKSTPPAAGHPTTPWPAGTPRSPARAASSAPAAAAALMGDGQDGPLHGIHGVAAAALDL